jgi:hypothetical protein
MIRYYVNNKKQSNGDHEVHRKDCAKLPSDRKDLGEFDNCQAAVREAKKTYPQSNGCIHCSQACHTQ